MTLALGSIDGGRGGFVQDATAGIGIHLEDAPTGAIEPGRLVRVRGVLDTRYAQRIVRVEPSAIEVVGDASLPGPIALVTGEASEPSEGLRITLTGTVTEPPSALSDGLGITLDDGTGPIRVIAGPDAMPGLDPGTGDVLTATGPLGQRDSGGTGLAGYRLYAMRAGDIIVVPAPTPTPDPTADPTASPGPTASPSPTATPAPTAPTPSPSVTATPGPSAPVMTVAEARLVPVGRSAIVRGVVTAEAGRLGTPPLFAIGDATGGLPVKIADGQAAPARGTLVELHGTIADPYGQTELRLSAGGLTALGAGSLPVALALAPGAADEATEGRLARVKGTVIAGATRSTSGDTSFSIEGSDGVALRILSDATAGIDATDIRKGATVTLTGIVGQRASRKGALDGYRLWVRDPGDVSVAAAPSPSGGSPSPSASHAAAVPQVSIKAARDRDGKRVTVEGTVTIDRTLLDTSGRRTVVEDGTGAIELYLAAADGSIEAGVRVRATGTVGTAWGAPRLRVETIRVLGRRAPVVRGLDGAPREASEWRLVRVKGTLEEVHRSGDRWTAELVAGTVRVPLVGLPGSGIAPADVIEGRRATVVGIVKRAYPTATDQRFGVVPRSRADLDLGAATGSPSPSGSPGSTGSPLPGASSPGGPGGSAPVPAEGATDIALIDLPASVGLVVRVGGVVASVDDAGIRLDDGTATGLVVLEGEAAELRSMIQVGDTLNATGTPDDRDEVVLVVTDPAALVLLGDLGGGDAPSDDPTGGRSVGAAVPPLGPDAATAAAVLAGSRAVSPFVIGIGALALGLAIGVALFGWRLSVRRRDERARIRARLEAFVASGPPPLPVRAPGGEARL